MDAPRKHGIFVRYNIKKDNNILDLDRSFKSDSISARVSSERKIDSLQKAKCQFFNGERNKDYVCPKFVSSIMTSENKNYSNIKNSVLNSKKNSTTNLTTNPTIPTNASNSIKSNKLLNNVTNNNTSNITNNTNNSSKGYPRLIKLVNSSNTPYFSNHYESRIKKVDNLNNLDNLSNRSVRSDRSLTRSFSCYSITGEDNITNSKKNHLIEMFTKKDLSFGDKPDYRQVKAMERNKIISNQNEKIRSLMKHLGIKKKI